MQGQALIPAKRAIGNPASLPKVQSLKPIVAEQAEDLGLIGLDENRAGAAQILGVVGQKAGFGQEPSGLAPGECAEALILQCSPKRAARGIRVAVAAHQSTQEIVAQT